VHFGRGRAVAVFQDHSPSPNFELILVWMASNQNAVFFFVIVDNSHLFYLPGWLSIQRESYKFAEIHLSLGSRTSIRLLMIGLYLDDSPFRIYTRTVSVVITDRVR